MRIRSLGALTVALGTLAMTTQPGIVKPARTYAQEGQKLPADKNGLPLKDFLKFLDENRHKDSKQGDEKFTYADLDVAWNVLNKKMEAAKNKTGKAYLTDWHSQEINGQILWCFREVDGNTSLDPGDHPKVYVTRKQIEAVSKESAKKGLKDGRIALGGTIGEVLPALLKENK